MANKKKSKRFIVCCSDTGVKVFDNMKYAKKYMMYSIGGFIKKFKTESEAYRYVDKIMHERSINLELSDEERDRDFENEINAGMKAEKEANKKDENKVEKVGENESEFEGEFEAEKSENQHIKRENDMCEDKKCNPEYFENKSYKKVYVVAAGRNPGVYFSKAEAKFQVSGVRGKFREFSNKDMAIDYLVENNIFITKEIYEKLNLLNSFIPNRASKYKNDIHKFNKALEYDIYSLKGGEAIIFTDGSYKSAVSEEFFGGAALIFTENKDVVIGEAKKKKKHYSNISAEALGLKKALDWIEKNELKKSLIYCDSQTLFNLANDDTVKFKNPELKKLKQYLSKMREKSDIRVEHISGHSRYKYNELVDKYVGDLTLNAIFMDRPLVKQKILKKYDKRTLEIEGRNLSSILTELRLRENISAKDMARDLGISQTFMTAVERGDKKIPDNFIGKVNDAYKLPEYIKNELEVAVILAKEEINFNIQGLDNERRELLIDLKKRIGDMERKDVKAIKAVLEEIVD